MQRGDAVDGVAAEEGEVAHADPAAMDLLDQRGRGEQAVVGAGEGADVLEVAGVEEVDQLHVAREQALHQVDGPGLERFGQQRVIGVGDAGDRQLPGFGPGEAVDVHEEAHQFDDDDGGVGVVELDGDFVG